MLTVEARSPRRSNEVAVGHPLLEDPFVAAEIEHALAPFAAALAPRELDWSRERLAEMVAEDPALLALLRDAHPRTTDESGERLRPGLTAPPAMGEPATKQGTPGKP